MPRMQRRRKTSKRTKKLEFVAMPYREVNQAVKVRLKTKASTILVSKQPRNPNSPKARPQGTMYQQVPLSQWRPEPRNKQSLPEQEPSSANLCPRTVVRQELTERTKSTMRSVVEEKRSAVLEQHSRRPGALNPPPPQDVTPRTPRPPWHQTAPTFQLQQERAAAPRPHRRAAPSRTHSNDPVPKTSRRSESPKAPRQVRSAPRCGTGYSLMSDSYWFYWYTAQGERNNVEIRTTSRIGPIHMAPLM